MSRLQGGTRVPISVADPETIDRRFDSLVEQMWVKETWASRRAVWTQYAEYHRQLHGEEPTAVHDATAVEYLLSREGQLSDSSIRQYAKALRAIDKVLHMPSLDLTQKALASRGVEPEQQALPMTKATFYANFRSAPREWQPMLLLLWKSASRVADWTKICAEDLEKCTEGLFVRYGTKTKTTRRDPHRIDAATIISLGDFKSEIYRWFASLKKNTPVMPFTTAQLDALVAQWPLNAQEKAAAAREEIRPRFSSYSFKRGAVEHLAQEAAKGNLDPNLIPVIAKHKHQQTMMPSVTMRYTTKLPLLRALGIPKATALL